MMTFLTTINIFCNPVKMKVSGKCLNLPIFSSCSLLNNSLSDLPTYALGLKKEESTSALEDCKMFISYNR